MDSGQLEHRAHAAAGDDAGTFAGGPEHHARRIEPSDRPVRDRGVVLGHGEDVLLGVLDRFGDRQRNLARLSVADSDAVDLVTDRNQRGEGETPTALDYLGDAVDLDHALFQLTWIG